ncbi:hypothetical protein H206_01390 [Candidatus Electrothrix aarhusensis]|jgi:hypothetical protein|uniref:Uncharacterized protein n=1 Tax=Candidatus Electrothrix aarhusensis TaxID=1859131 RepID=A0A3S3QFS1_9BACT|nr:hypothetical protein H206_01390 [Candidatus Electrothrix aarhusensis]
MKQHSSTTQLPRIQVIRLEAGWKYLTTMLIGSAMFGNSVNQVYAEKWKEQGYGKGVNLFCYGGKR